MVNGQWVPEYVKNLIFWRATGVYLVPEILEIAENQQAVSFSAYRKFG
jgi:hypothetical protein